MASYAEAWSLQHWCSLDVVLQIIKSLIKLIVLKTVFYILLAGFTIWVFKNFPGVISPDPTAGRATTSRTHPRRGAQAQQPWSPSTFQPWLATGCAPGQSLLVVQRYGMTETCYGCGWVVNFLFGPSVIGVPRMSLGVSSLIPGSHDDQVKHGVRYVPRKRAVLSFWVPLPKGPITFPYEWRSWPDAALKSP